MANRPAVLGLSAGAVLVRSVVKKQKATREVSPPQIRASTGRPVELHPATEDPDRGSRKSAFHQKHDGRPDDQDAGPLKRREQERRGQIVPSAPVIDPEP